MYIHIYMYTHKGAPTYLKIYIHRHIKLANVGGNNIIYIYIYIYTYIYIYISYTRIGAPTEL